MNPRSTALEVNTLTITPPMNPRSIALGGVMVSVFTSSAVDRGFIGSVIVSVFTSSAVDHGFIGGVIVSVFTSPLHYRCGSNCFEKKEPNKHTKTRICILNMQKNSSETIIFVKKKIT
jgi:hypothetical protein